MVTRLDGPRGAGPFGDLADDTAAGSASDLLLNLANAEIGGRGKCLDLADDRAVG